MKKARKQNDLELTLNATCMFRKLISKQQKWEKLGFNSRPKLVSYSQSLSQQTRRVFPSVTRDTNGWGDATSSSPHGEVRKLKTETLAASVRRARNVVRGHCSWTDKTVPAKYVHIKLEGTRKEVHKHMEHMSSIKRLLQCLILVILNLTGKSLVRRLIVDIISRKSRRHLNQFWE